MNIKHNARAVLFGMAVAVAVAPGAFASSDITKVMIDPCAKVLNSAVRAITYDATPPSERGLQCPIQEQFGSPLND
ncbi:MAG: hypothetical protein JO084_04045 [Bradyrhizobiaceae bacterium]|nr:hypothetical protein [Bradyrhizobiaceae bacterium]